MSADSKDEWELSDDSGKMSCCECGQLFSYERIIDISYTTVKVEK